MPAPAPPLRAAIAEAGAEDIAASADVDSVAAAKAQALTLIDKAEARAETARSRVRANEMVSEPSIEKAEAWEALASAIARHSLRHTMPGRDATSTRALPFPVSDKRLQQ